MSQKQKIQSKKKKLGKGVKVKRNTLKSTMNV